jgi:ABC-type transport system involved in multi-copper enzyme maturation permease subunit
VSQALRYRPLECVRVTGFRRLWPLARQEMMALFRSKLGVGLFFFSLFPSLGRLVMLMIVFGVVDFGPRGLRDRMTQSLPPELDHLNPERAAFYFETALSTMPGMVFFLMLTSVVVSRSVARDRATNGLELYWTRGISPIGYVFAKWLGGFLLTATMTVLMPLALWFAAVLLAEDWSLLADTAGQFAAGLAGMALMTAIWTGVGTLLSAIATSANLAMVLWAMLMIGSSAVGFILSRALREPALKSCLSFWDAGRVVVRDLAALPQRDDVSVLGAYTMLLSVTALVVVLAGRRIRVAEALQ